VTPARPGSKADRCRRLAAAVTSTRLAPAIAASGELERDKDRGGKRHGGAGDLPAASWSGVGGRSRLRCVALGGATPGPATPAARRASCDPAPVIAASAESHVSATLSEASIGL
jgi:hypothetical protein